MATLDLWSMAFVFLLATFVGFQVIQMLPGGLADRFLSLVLDVFPGVQPINRGPEYQKGCSGPH